MLVSGGPIAKYGIIRDLPDTELPDGAWSDGEDVRFEDGYVKRYSGHDQDYFTGYGSGPGVTSGSMRFAYPVRSATDYFWIMIHHHGVSAGEAWVFDYSTFTEITRAAGGDYTSGNSIKWTADTISGLPVFCNGHNDSPQIWATLTTGTNLTPLDYVTGTSTWDGLGYTCSSIRTFDKFLVAVDVDKGTRDPYMLKWSHPATSATQPASWDETDTTKKAGERILDNVGHLIDSYTMGNTHIIYGQDGMYGMQLIGGKAVFRTFKLPINVGALSQNCVRQLKGGHVVLTQDMDLVFHDGRSAQSVLDKAFRRFLRDDVDDQYLSRSFTSHNVDKNEIWLFYVADGSLVPSRHIIWNYKENTFTRSMETSLSTAYTAAFGVVDTDNEVRRRLLIGSSTSNQVWATDSASTILNAGYSDVYVERTGIHFGKPKEWKRVTAIWPRMKSGGKIRVQIGGAESPYDTYTWEDEVLFDPATDGKRVETRTHYPYLGIRFKNDDTAANDFQLSAFDWEIESSGKQ